ncbi:TPA: recombinase family protein [Photobacterium damselae]
MSIAYSYIRFSSIQQAHGDSLRRQSQLAANYCNDHNLTLSETNYQDLGVSAYHSANTQEDKGLGQFLTALEQGVIADGSYLLVESLDRLSRAKVQVALRQMLNIIEYGIKIVTLIDGKIYDIESDTTDLIISLTIMERAHDESRTKSERVKAAWAYKRQNPHTTNRHSSTPFWLQLNDDKRTYTVKEEYSEIIKKIYQLSIDGWGVIKIVRFLNNEKIPAPKGGSWASTTVYRTLTSKAVLGHYEPRKNRTSMNTLIENYYPAILDETTYYQAQKRRTERSIPEAAGRKTEFPNPLNQIAKCKLCGSPMVYDNKSETLKYLTCREFKKKNCTNKPIRMELIYRFIVEVFHTPLYHKHHAGLAKKVENKDDNVEKELEVKLEAEQEALRGLLSLSSDFSNSVILGEIKTRSERIQELEKRLENVKAENAIKETQTVHTNYLEALQLTANAFNYPLEGIKIETLTKQELFEARVKINRVLKQTFDSLIINHCKESKTITINTNIYNYKASSDSIKKPTRLTTWFVAPPQCNSDKQ